MKFGILVIFVAKIKQFVSGAKTEIVLGGLLTKELSVEKSQITPVPFVELKFENVDRHSYINPVSPIPGSFKEVKL